MLWRPGSFVFSEKDGGWPSRRGLLSVFRTRGIDLRPVVRLDEVSVVVLGGPGERSAEK